MFIISFLACVFIASYHAIQFHKCLVKSSEIWLEYPDVKVFGVSSQSALRLYSDLPFLNALWDGNGLDTVAISSLKQSLSQTRHHFRKQIWFGLLALLCIVLNGVVLA